MSNTPILTITLRQAENLVAFFGGHDTEVSVGPGLDGTQSLMAWCTEYPEEGAVDLGPTEVDDELANIGRPIAMNAPAGEVAEACKREAQQWKQEARTANATIAEIYQLCTGKTGEPGNWNGAKPVRELIERLAPQRDAPAGEPFKVETWPVDADGFAPDLCTECGTPVRYGSRHSRCGEKVQAAERALASPPLSAQPAAEPLSYEEVANMLQDHARDSKEMHDFARAVEAAHGIGTPQAQPSPEVKS